MQEDTMWGNIFRKQEIGKPGILTVLSNISTCTVMGGGEGSSGSSVGTSGGIIGAGGRREKVFPWHTV